MIRRAACLSVLSLLVFLSSFSSDNQANAQNQLGASGAQTVHASQSQKRAINRAAVAKSTARRFAQSAPPTNIGFLGAPRTFAGGGIPGIFPAVMGNFGNGFESAATIVNTGAATNKFSISVALNNGAGSFTNVLTTLTGEDQQDPIFVGQLKGSTETTDDIVVVHPAASPNQTTIEAWLSNGDGTFTAGSQGTVPVTTNGFVWATIADVNGDGCPDVVLADAGTPNGNIWTILGKGDGSCDGSFGTPTSVAFTGALSAGSPTQGVPGNPMVFTDFNGDGSLDFAAPSATTNQIMVYLCSSGASPCTSYAAPVGLATTDNVYGSCFLGGGVVATGSKGDLVSANCVQNGGTITVYLNTGNGSFKTGAYYPSTADPVTRFPNPTAIAIGDINGDGKNDIVVTDLNDSAVEVFLGNGDGTVNVPTAGYSTGGSPFDPPLVADFNGDGKLDVVVPDNQQNFVFLEGYGDGSFRSAINYYALHANGGFQPEGEGLASGDFNGDGIPDIVIGNADGTNAAPVTVFLSNADGSFQPGVNYTPPISVPNYEMQFVAVADFNGDGILDIAASDTYRGLVQIFYGVGDGTFNVGPTYVTESTGGTNLNPVGIVTADFNGDGKPDLAIVNNNSGTAPTTADVGVLINNGTGFNPVANYALSTVATEITAADVNGDGKLDLTVPLYGVCFQGSCSAPGNAVAVLLGNGDGTFTAKPNFQLPSTFLNPYNAAVADINGDGKADLVVTIQDVTEANQGIAVALGNGDGTFQTPTLLNSSAQSPALPGYVQIVDLNRDGFPDLVYTNALSGTVGVMYGQGNGTFYSPLEFATNRWAWDFALIDVNGDGVLDAVTSGFEQAFSGVGVLLNTSGNSTALTTSAAQVNVGQSVTFKATITGSTVRGVTTAPTGTVTFLDGTTKLGTPVTITAGVASLTTSFATAGTQSITAAYSGDTNYIPTTSGAVQETVVPVAVQPDYTLASTPTTQTVNPGTAATYKITVTPTNGYNGTISFPASACSALPTGASCSFSPSTLPGSGSTTLTITTTAPTSGMLIPADVNPHGGGTGLMASLTGFGLMGIVLVGDLRKRKRHGAIVLLTVLTLALVLSLVGCGGGSSSGGGGGGGGGGGTGGTPSGTYAVKLSVTGTAGTNGGNTAAHPLGVTLVVN